MRWWIQYMFECFFWVFVWPEVDCGKTYATVKNVIKLGLNPAHMLLTHPLTSSPPQTLPFLSFAAIPDQIRSVAEKTLRHGLRPNREKCRQIGPKPLPHAPYTSPDLILASCHAISSIRSHFQPNPLGRRKKARRHWLRSKRKKMSSNWAKSPSTCSIHIPRLDPDLVRCHFIHSQLFLTKSARWRK